MNLNFTELTVSKGDTAKKYIVKTPDSLEIKSAATISEATAEVKSIPVEDFSSYLDSLAASSDKCITLGVCDKSPARLTTKVRQQKNQDEFISRTKEFFHWCNGGSIGLIYLDFDTDASPASREDFLCDLDALLQPALIGKTQTERTRFCRWYRGSTSSSVKVHGKVGTGLHVFIPVKGDATGLVQLFHRFCWLNGNHKGYTLTKAGTVLPESLIDGTVGSAERVIYTADAQIINPDNLSWVEKVSRTCRYTPGGVLDAPQARDIMTVVCSGFRYEWNLYRREIEREPSVIAKKKAWREAYQKTLQNKHKLSPKQAKTASEALEKQVLLSNFTLLRTDSTRVSVREILLDPDTWIGKTHFTDPINMDVNRNVGMIMGTSDNLFLHSFSHGGVNYYLRWGFEDLLAWVDSADEDHVEEKFAEYGLLCSADGLTPIQEDKYKEAVFDKLGVSKSSIRRILTQTKKELGPKLQEEVEKEEQKLDFGAVYDSAEGVPPEMLPENASHGDILNDLTTVLPKHYVFGSVLYVWSGRDIWTPWSLSALQKEIAARYNHVGRCKRVSDYRAIAGAVLSSDELRKEAWRETPGFPVEDGIYEVNRDGFEDADPESGFKFIRKREYHYEDYCRYKLMFKPDFSFDVEKSNFKRILDNVDNPVLLQQLCGLAVAGLLPLTQMAATFYGDGGSGKGVMFNILESLFPKERVTSVSLEQMNDQKYRIGLADARLNLVSEVQAVTRPDLTGFKEIVGGNLITGRALYLPPVAFTPCVGMVLSMNKLFRLGEVGTAVERRFSNSIVKFVKRNKEQIEGLDRMIIENELPGILAWCMTGVELWADVGLDTDLSNRLWDQWKESEDIITLFFSECVMEGGRGLSRRELWDAFRDYCKNAGVSPLRKGDFYDAASKVLGPSVKHCGVQMWRGYSLNTGITTNNIYE